MKVPNVPQVSVRRRRAVLGAAAALPPLLGCEITVGRQKADGPGGRGVAARRPPVRLGVSTGYMGDGLALDAWRAASTRLRETGGPDVSIEPHDVRLPDAAALEPQGRVPALEHLFAADAAPDAFVWTGQLPAERVALVDRGLVQPVVGLLRASGAGGRASGRSPLAEYASGALDALRDGDSVYGLPVEATPLLLMVDSRLVGSAPAARPLREGRPEVWTWSAFEEASAQLLRLGERGALDANSRWGFAPLTALPLDVLLWQHGAQIESGGRQSTGQAADPTAWTPGQPGGPRVRIGEPAARAALALYARLLRAALGPAVALPVGQRPDSQLDFQWGPSGMRLGAAPVAMSTMYGVPRWRLPAASAERQTDPAGGTVVVAPLPHLPSRVGTVDPAATQLRVSRFVAISARAQQPAETALALHGLIGLVSAEAAPIPARLPAPGAPPLPFLTYLPAAERSVIVEALAHSRAYPPRAELTLSGYVLGRVRRPLLEEPARAGALEEALAALLRLAA